MKDYKLYIKNFILDLKYSLPVLITSLLSFGFTLTHHTVNVDTLAYDRYFLGSELLCQSRFTAFLIDKIFHIMNFNPFFVDCLAVIFLILSAMLYCSLFKKITNNKLSSICYTIFSCFFISYPLITEIFVYTPASLNICLAYFLIACSLILTYENIKNNKKFFWIFSSVIICLCISLYESFASVYLLGIFIILILDILCNSEEKIILKSILILFVKLLIPLIIGFILEFIVSEALIKLLCLAKSTNADKTIYYKTLGVIPGIKNLLKTINIKYFIVSICYLPITMFVLSTVVSVLEGIIFSFKKRNIVILILFFGLFLSAISLSFLQGNAAPYRTCQTFSIFIGFIFMLIIQIILTSKIINWIKTCFLVILFVLIFYQAQDIHHWFYINYLRYEEEKNFANFICHKIEVNCDTSKPLVILGSYTLSNNVLSNVYLSSNSWKGKILVKIINKLNYQLINYNSSYIYKISETNVNSYISWGNVAFKEPGVETVKFFNLLGYDYTCASRELYDETKYLSSTLPKWPKEGSIVEYDNYIVVNMY